MAEEREIYALWGWSQEGRRKKSDKPDLVGKVVRLKSHQKFGMILSVDWGNSTNYRDDRTAEVIWIVGYEKPKKTTVALSSLYGCDNFINDMEAEIKKYKANMEKVTDYYDKP